MVQFKDRSEETKEIGDLLKSSKFECLILYGRRRIGKTALALHCIQPSPSSPTGPTSPTSPSDPPYKAIYFLAEQIDNLHRFALTAAEIVPEIAQIKEDYHILLDFLKDKVDAIVIDEFQNMVVETPNLPHILQGFIDLKAKQTRLKLILIGSSISLMTAHVLASPSPLFGRKTAAMKLGPISFPDLAAFFPEKPIAELVEIYAFADGIPYYLEQIDATRPFWAWLADEIRRKASFLRNELEFLIRYEFMRPEMYLRVLEAVATGNTELNTIATKLQVKTTDITAYIRTLIEVDFIVRERPLGDRPNSRNSRYYLKDNFLKFWFRYIWPNRGKMEQGLFRAEEIAQTYPAYVGLIFELAVLQYLLRYRPIPFTEIGRWWWRDVEIDLIAYNEPTGMMTFIECKWQEGVDGPRVAAELQQKARNVRRPRRQEQFIVVAKSFKPAGKMGAKMDANRADPNYGASGRSLAVSSGATKGTSSGKILESETAAKTERPREILWLTIGEMELQIKKKKSNIRDDMGLSPSCYKSITKDLSHRSISMVIAQSSICGLNGSSKRNFIGENTREYTPQTTIRPA